MTDLEPDASQGEEVADIFARRENEFCALREFLDEDELTRYRGHLEAQAPR